ncbi:MAG TPA: DNA replication/repair protein RecF [Bacteroidales bacterium]|jgi:DNA replication and repair protein RecF|nr:DNA replication/repair protein RecF [Bacteroidales bacterium]MDD4235330.1 DNA replication/repair protein RecF [Bacteroidales bacterium]HXK81502.1 DNA replication/repair protein RecF [Bacteroidales bacterium]
MKLEQLTIINFKNFDSFELKPAPKFNCFTGPNGIGKTNLLDAIYYLSFAKSFLQSADKLHIKHGEDYFALNGKFTRKEEIEEIACSVKKSQKKVFKRNGKEYDRLSDHIGLIPLVYTAPFDISMVIGGSDTRRRFIDTVISQFDKDYLRKIIKYQRALDQRNQVLKSFSANKHNDEAALEIWDMQLAKTGNEIFEIRNQFANEITPIFNEYYKRISGNRDDVKLIYVSQIFKNSLENLLKNSRQKDILFQYTTSGIHKDDLEFMLDEYLIRKTGSQGQQKTFVLALKLAQFDYIKQKTGLKPILLLDDIFDKLDSFRINTLIEIVSDNNFGQIFLTDTNYERTLKLVDKISEDSKLVCLEN